MKIDPERYRKKHPVITRIFRTLKYYFLLLIRKEDSPENIAHGLATGVFIGFLPIIPLQALTALTVCTIFKTNKLAAIIGTNVFTNYLTAAPVFYFLHFLGRIFILHDFTYYKFKSIFRHINIHNLGELGKEMLLLFQMISIGGLIVGAASYPVVFYISRNYIMKRRRKVILKRLRRKNRKN